jgi:hypothetical protein
MTNGKPHIPPRHGTLSGYTIDGCREECCRGAHRAYMNRYRTRRGLGGGIMVDAAPVIAHLDRCLSAGMTPNDIVKAAGWRSRNSIDSVRKAKKVKPETARRVLSIVPVPGRGRAMTYVSGYYTARRLKVLREVHGSYAQIARLINVSKETPRDIVTNPQRQVRRATAMKVLDLWAQHLRSIDFEEIAA